MGHYGHSDPMIDDTESSLKKVTGFSNGTSLSIKGLGVNALKIFFYSRLKNRP